MTDEHRTAMKELVPPVPTGLTVAVQAASRVTRVGNALHISIPMKMARLMGLHAGDTIAMVLEHNVIRLAKCNFFEVIGMLTSRHLKEE
jgi:antitoxin component of MazEF toxin-antitoxin module